MFPTPLFDDKCLLPVTAKTYFIVALNLGEICILLMIKNEEKYSPVKVGCETFLSCNLLNQRLSV